MKPEKKKGRINLYDNGCFSTGKEAGDEVYITEDEALRHIKAKQNSSIKL